MTDPNVSNWVVDRLEHVLNQQFPGVVATSLAENSKPTKKSRKNLDFYQTPDFATEILLKQYSYLIVDGAIIEPCCGDRAISKQLETKFGKNRLIETDIDPARNPRNGVFDATNPATYLQKSASGETIRSVITNPPFNCAMNILKTAYESPDVEVIALLLRLSFLEGTFERGPFLNQHPPKKLIILPRISFTGDGNTDSVTCAWMIWCKNINFSSDIYVCSKPEKVKISSKKSKKSIKEEQSRS
jgi:hypothetical protein